VDSESTYYCSRLIDLDINLNLMNRSSIKDHGGRWGAPDRGARFASRQPRLARARPRTRMDEAPSMLAEADEPGLTLADAERPSSQPDNTGE
jgi:hypothetical protein